MGEGNLSIQVVAVLNDHKGSQQFRDAGRDFLLMYVLGKQYCA